MDRAGLSMNRAIKRQIRNYFISLNDLYDNKEDILSVRRPSSFYSRIRPASELMTQPESFPPRLPERAEQLSGNCRASLILLDL